MKKLTVKEFLDIMFQTEERLTKSILDNLSPWQKLRQKCVYATDRYVGTESKKSRFCLIFNKFAEIDRPHERAVMKAKRELLAYGYSHKAVNELMVYLNDAIISVLTQKEEVKSALEEGQAFLSLSRHDDAFLGLAFKRSADKEYLYALPRKVETDEAYINGSMSCQTEQALRSAVENHIKNVGTYWQPVLLADVSNTYRDTTGLRV